MEIKQINVRKIKPNSWNPNRLTGLKYDALVKQISKDRALRQPLLVRKKADFYEIIDGEHRWKAAQQAGLEEIPCVIARMDEVQAKTATIAMNNIKGKFDDLPLASLIAELNKSHELEDLKELLAFNERELHYYLKLLEAPKDLSETIQATEEQIVTLNFLVSPEEEKIVTEALESIDADNKSKALVNLCREWNKEVISNR